jgi:hypothetical protein
MHELKRILSDRKRLFIYLIIPVLCVMLFFLERLNGDLKSGWRYMLDDAAQYRQDAEKYCAMQPEDALAAMEADGYRAGFGQMTNLKTAAEHIRSYRTYLAGVHENAERMSRSSIFGKDENSFTYRNVQKTDADFVALKEITVAFGSDRAVETWLNFTTSDLLFLVVIILTVMAFFEDKKNGLCSVVRSCPKGRLQLALSRFTILVGVSLVFTLLIDVGVLGSSFALYGGTDGLFRTVQSMEAFKTCTLRVSILEWILLYLGAKVACGVLLGLIFWFILSFLSNIQLSWLIIISILAGEYAAFSLIDGQLQCSAFKYVNLFSYVYPMEPLSKYLNMNVFGYPVGVFPLLRWLMLALMILLTVALLFIQMKRHPLGNRNILGRFVLSWNRFCDFFRRKMHIPAFEGYKQLIFGGSILFLAVCLYVGGRLSYTGWEYQEQDYVYLQYLGEIAGPIDEQTDAYIENAWKSLDSHPDIAYEFENSLMRLEDEAGAAKQNAAEKGYEPWLLDQVQVQNFLGEKTWSLTRWNAIVALAFVILSVAPLFAIERKTGTEKLLRSTSRGRSPVFRAKYFIMTLETSAIWCCVYLREWLAIRTVFGAELLNCPIQNFVSLQSFPIVMRFGTLLILLYLLRFVGLMIAAFVTAYFSAHANTWEKAMLLGAAVLLFPAALFYFGQEWAGYLSVLPNIAATELLVSADRLGGVFVRFAAWLALAAALSALVYRNWVRRAGNPR